MLLLASALVLGAPAAPPYAGLFVWTAGAPILHAVHGQTTPAWVSLAARGAAPLGGALVGAIFGGVARSKKERESSDLSTMIAAAGVGAAIGTLAAVVYDGVAGFESAKTASPIPTVASCGTGLCLGVSLRWL